MKYLILCLAMLTISCAQKTKWNYAGTKNNKGEHVVKLDTEWGEIELQPQDILAETVELKVILRNNSSQAVKFSSDDIFMKDGEGYSLYPLSQNEVKEKWQAKVNFAGAMIGARYLTASAASQQVAGDVAKRMLRFGMLRPKSAIRGSVFFPANDNKVSQFKVFFSENISKKDLQAVFQAEQQKRRTSSFRKRK